MMRDAVDLTEVRPEHAEIHARLENWARWCRGGGGGSSMLAMFRHYRSGYPEPPHASIPIDSLDGHRMEKAVIALPEKHRTVLQWWYCKPYIPIRRVCQAVAVPYAALNDLVHDARSMLKNRSK